MKLRLILPWLGLLVLGCSGPAGDIPLFPEDQLQEGDLAFRCGLGVFSRAVTVTDEKGTYSHVGMLVRDGNAWKVVHAVPGEREFKDDFDRVKMEPLSVFFGPKRAKRGCLVHTGVTDSLRVERLRTEAMAAARDRVRFDDDYDLLDSSKVYCTEFVWRLYRRVGVDLSEGRRRAVNVFRISGDCLLPDHLYQYSANETYYSF